MKTAEDICRDFPSYYTITTGKDGFYTCQVMKPDNTTHFRAHAPTLEGAEDTAWHAMKITTSEP